jgi:hypothetical protein
MNAFSIVQNTVCTLQRREVYEYCLHDAICSQRVRTSHRSRQPLADSTKINFKRFVLKFNICFENLFTVR